MHDAATRRERPPGMDDHVSRAPRAMTGAVLRTAAPPDNEQIRAIWNLEVASTTANTETEPRSAAEQEAWLARHGVDHPVIVAAVGDEVVAFGCLSPYRSRPAYRLTVEDSVYVKSGRRGRGLGDRMLGELLRMAAERRYHSVIGRIVAGNQASLTLHERHGFRVVGVEREIAFKLGRWQDVVTLQARVAGAT